MPTKHYSVAALCTGTTLIVAGGYDDNGKSLKTVEVLSTETRQWHTAPDLPEPLAESSLILCGDLVYLLGGVKEFGDGTHSALQKMNGCFNPFFLLPQFHASLLIRYISFSAFANVPESAWPLSCLLFGM